MGGADPARGALSAALERGEPSPLQELGIRYVVLPEELVEHQRPGVETLNRVLGAPWSDTPGEGLIIWDLGPTEAHCLGEDL